MYMKIILCPQSLLVKVFLLLRCIEYKKISRFDSLYGKYSVGYLWIGYLKRSLDYSVLFSLYLCRPQLLIMFVFT